jgi:hypothetical protein
METNDTKPPQPDPTKISHNNSSQLNAAITRSKKFDDALNETIQRSRDKYSDDMLNAIFDFEENRGKDAGSFEFRVGELVDAMFAGSVNSGQRQAASQAINAELNLQGQKAIAPQDSENKEKWRETLIAGINAKYEGSSDKLTSFLNAVQKPEVGLPDNNPLKTYKSQF